MLAHKWFLCSISVPDLIRVETRRAAPWMREGRKAVKAVFSHETTREKSWTVGRPDEKMNDQGRAGSLL